MTKTERVKNLQNIYKAVTQNKRTFWNLWVKQAEKNISNKIKQLTK